MRPQRNPFAEPTGAQTQRHSERDVALDSVFRLGKHWQMKLYLALGFFVGASVGIFSTLLLVGQCLLGLFGLPGAAVAILLDCNTGVMGLVIKAAVNTLFYGSLGMLCTW